MRSSTKCLVAVLWLVGFSWTGAYAQDHPAKGASKPEPSKENLVQTRHALTLGGSKLEYEATAGPLVLKDEEGKPRANIFFVAYTRLPADNPTQRPITFLFNGGPGAAAVWLHLGAFGPRRIVLDEAGKTVAPPYHLTDNPTTLLDLTDLVFVDPVTTGYSRAVPGQEAKQFHSVEGDVQAMAAFIRQYTTQFQRWDSPKFLAGESYGTTRAVSLGEYLQDREGLDLNGIILLSTILNFETLGFDEGNDLPYSLYLPSYTATAWYHHKLAPDLQADRSRTLDEVEKFAAGEYSLALQKGSTLSPDDREEVVRKLARYTGLSEDYVRRSDLRIESSRFRKELLRHERKMVGRFDSRAVGSDTDAVDEGAEYDPSYVAVQGAFTALVNQYLRNELNYVSDQQYRILTGKVQPWDFGSKNRYLNVVPDLRRAMTKNAGLRVFVAQGLYDLATPYQATAYTFHHLSYDPTLENRVTIESYPGGHMMYTNADARQKLKKDLTLFFQTSLGKKAEPGETAVVPSKLEAPESGKKPGT